MDDKLLPYYNRELAFFQTMAGEFAQAHPDIAKHLRLSAGMVEDPHVSRLIQGVAFLNARVSAKLDDDYPELVEALLGVLYPHYLAPIPSMAVAQFEGKPEATGPGIVRKGTELDTDPKAGPSCRFRTAYDTTLWPIALEQAELGSLPLAAPPNPQAGDAAAVLRLSLRCQNDQARFDQLRPDTLRFFLRGQPQQTYALHELIFNNTISVALADGPDDGRPVILGADCIRPVGFGTDEGLLNYPARSHLGYRLLTEYFAFPEKFLFFDIGNLQAKATAGNRLELYFYLDRTDRNLERVVSTDSFALGCTPVVNLFRQRAEPIRLDQTRYEHPIVPDVRRPDALEVHSVESVRGIDNATGRDRPFLPFYALRHGGREARNAAFWTITRRPAGGADPGTTVFLSLTDPDFNPAAPSAMVLDVDTHCSNRDLPAGLLYGGRPLSLGLVEPNAAVHAATCISPPTATLRLGERQGLRWRLVSHLLLNHLTFSGGKEGADSLREILRLYDFRDSAETRARIDGIVSVSARRAVARMPVRPGDVPWSDAMCRGTDVTVEFDPTRFNDGGLFLLAMALDHFLGLACSINSFTRLTATVRGRTGVLRTWPPRAGDRPLL